MEARNNKRASDYELAVPLEASGRFGERGVSLARCYTVDPRDLELY